jgi:hypothetical protein
VIKIRRSSPGRAEGIERELALRGGLFSLLS